MGRVKELLIEVDDAEDASTFLNAYNYKDALEDIWQQCFRPNNKHGYPEEELNAELAYRVIEILSEKYLMILSDREINV